MTHQRQTRLAVALLHAATLAVVFFGAAGCSLAPEITGLKSGSTNITYNPSPDSEAFKRLRLEETKSVVVLNIEGDDVVGSIEKVHRVMLDKGYAVRDIGKTLLTLKRSNMLGKKTTSPEYLKRASAAFAEQVAIGGRIEVTQAEPTRVLISLHLIDLKKQKIVWSVKASYVGRYIGVPNPFERAVTESVEKALSVLPRANP